MKIARFDDDIVWGLGSFMNSVTREKRVRWERGGEARGELVVRVSDRSSAVFLSPVPHVAALLIV